MKLKKEKYLPQIEARKFKRASIFRQSYLVINGIKSKIVCNHVTTKKSFDEYVRGMNEVDGNTAYLIHPLIKVDLSNNSFDVFDLFILGNDMYIKKVYTRGHDINLEELYFSGVLLLQKNLAPKMDIDVGTKITFRRV